MSEILDGEFIRNEMNENAMSGSELMATNLIKHLGKENLDGYQIVLSRLRGPLCDDKIRLMWCHDLPEDPESDKVLGNGGWKRFHRLVFVSVVQCQNYIQRYGIPWNRTIVLRNAIDPISVDMENKTKINLGEKIKFIYHTTPHRGLGLLVPVIEKLTEHHKNIHLDVYSSFKLYGWEEHDKQFEPLYEHIRNSEYMTYHGAVDNDTVRAALLEADIFAYPSAWTETSCIALIEAMSAGLVCVHPDNGALFETASNWTFQYHWDDDMSAHASHHYTMLNNMLSLLMEDSEAVRMKRTGMKKFADITYSWEVRAQEWKTFLRSIADLPKPIEVESKESFSYKVL